MKSVNKLILVLSIFFIVACDEEEPTKTMDSGLSSERLTISGNYLYTVYQDKLKIYDAEIPDQIQKINTYKNRGDIKQIFRYENMLIVKKRNSKFSVLDISQPMSIDYLSQLEIDISDYGDLFVLQNGFAYSAIRTEISGYLNTYDISDITDPIEVSLEFINAPYSIAASDNNLFICEDSEVGGEGGNSYSHNKLNIYDISEPDNITPIKIADLIECGRLKLRVENDILINRLYNNIEFYDVSEMPPKFLNRIPVSF